MPKYKKLYKDLKCDIDIPINDLDAWSTYKDYRWIYNRLALSEIQDVECAPMPIEPKKFPVIIKPIINLYGMGLNIKKVNSVDEFDDCWHSTDFWMEFKRGEHLSFDLIILKGEIVFCVCFKGHKMKKKLGQFRYWESVDREVPSNVLKVIGKFGGYSGCINLETIGSTIIEAHLRMGDIEFIPDKRVLEGVIQTYKELPFDGWPEEIPKVYFMPIWNKNHSRTLNKYLRKHVKPILRKNKYVLEYGVDDRSLASPGDTRVMWFTTSYKRQGFKLSKKIYKSINENIDVSI